MEKTLEIVIKELRKKDPDNKDLYDLLDSILEKPRVRIPKSKKGVAGEVFIPDEELIGSLKATPSVVGYSTYAHFAKKYKIPLTTEGKKKTMNELSKSIHKYELKNKNRIYKSGVDSNTGSYGLYI